MKYNEQKIKQLFQHETSIWQDHDLDWFDKDLAERLQNNKLPEDEKQELLDMMTHDQAVMDRYLALKQQKITVKSPFIQLFKSQMFPLFASALTLILALTFLINHNNNKQDLKPNIMRSISEASIYPGDASILKIAPDYFIIQNRMSDNLQVSLIYNKKTIWISDFQKSNKFHLPIVVLQQLESGQYTWVVKNKNSEINANYTFTVQ